MTATQTVERWYLDGLEGDGRMADRVAIGSLPFRIGRAEGLSLVIPAVSVSKLHAEIWHDGRHLRLRDLDSTNGTFVNGRRLNGQDVPLAHGDTIHFANVEYRLGFHGPSAGAATIEEPPERLITILTQFDRLFDDDGAIPYYQPIVTLPDRELVGYEVLARSELEGLRTPLEMFEIARRLGMEGDLSRLMRRVGVNVGRHLPGHANLFLNTDPAELDGTELVQSLVQLRRLFPDQPLTLEIHEASVTRIAGMKELRRTLTELKIGLAYDDFGTGQARLVDLVEVPPDYLKFDMRLVRDIHSASAQRQQMVLALVRMTHDLGIAALAEGVECAEEAEACRQLGFEFAQGYFFGRPAPLSHWQAG